MARRRSGTDDRHQRCEDPGAEDGDLRDRSAYLRVGRVGERERAGGADDWARICGRDCGGGRECVRLRAGPGGERRGPRGVRALPQLPGRAAASVRAHRGSWREPERGVRGVDCAADDQHLAARAVGGPGCGGDLRPAGECGAYGAGVSVRGRGRAGDRRGTDRDYGGGGGAAGGRAASSDLRSEPVPASVGGEGGRYAGGGSGGRRRCARCSGSLGYRRASTWGWRCRDIRRRSARCWRT
jgi:hypothetical protein